MFGWFKNRSAIPTAEAEPERYKGRPLLIVIENYVLSCIGHLPPESDARMQAIVHRMWPGPGDWKQQLRAGLRLEDSMDSRIRALWDRNLEIARVRGEELHPVQFAKMFADQNFAPSIEPRGMGA